jgi:hypothetical protein
MSEHGLELTMAALRTHLAALPWPRYELRLIDTDRRRCVATRYWAATQLLDAAVVRFLRARNRQGCDVYFRPYAAAESAGYLLLDFDAGPCPLANMQAAGHTPCVVVATSPGHQQAWVRVSQHGISPAGATAMARGLASRYGADPASAEWRHLGRLAGFTNRKPARLPANGLPPWVRLVWHAATAMAQVDDLVVPALRMDAGQHPRVATVEPCPSSLYHQGLRALRLRERFPQPDWSTADYRVARWLLQRGYHAAQVIDILRQGSPGFPRRHPKPDDYLRRTLQAAAATPENRRAFFRAPIPLADG